MNPKLFGTQWAARPKLSGRKKRGQRWMFASLEIMVDQEASDLYLTVDSLPVYRCPRLDTTNRRRRLLPIEQLEPRLSLMRGQQRGEYRGKNGMNLALYYKELGLSCQHFRQRGNVGLSFGIYQTKKSKP